MAGTSQPGLFDHAAPVPITQPEGNAAHWPCTCTMRRRPVWPVMADVQICGNQGNAWDEIHTLTARLPGRPGYAVILCGRCAAPVSVPLIAGLTICAARLVQIQSRRVTLIAETTESGEAA